MAVTSEEEFKAWLETQPREVCGAIAYRAAMRVLPYAMDLDRFKDAQHVALGALRCCLAAWVGAASNATYSGEAGTNAYMATVVHIVGNKVPGAMYAATSAAAIAADAAGNTQTTSGHLEKLP